MTKILNLISLWALPVIILTALTCGIIKKFRFMKNSQREQKTVLRFQSNYPLLSGNHSCNFNA